MPHKTSLQTDQEALKASADVQESTKNALARVQRTLAETQEAGATTLEELYAQRRKLEGIDRQGERLHDELDHTEYLQSKLGSWFGGKKKKRHPKKEFVEKESAPTDKPNVKKSNHKKWGFIQSSSKKPDPELPTFPAQTFDREKALYKGEHRAELDRIADEDREIDAQIDRIGDQLGGILKLAEEMRGETKHQGQRLEHINENLGHAQARQEKTSKRIKKFLR